MILRRVLPPHPFGTHTMLDVDEHACCWTKFGGHPAVHGLHAKPERNMLLPHAGLLAKQLKQAGRKQTLE